MRRSSSQRLRVWRVRGCSPCKTRVDMLRVGCSKTPDSRTPTVSDPGSSSGLCRPLNLRAQLGWFPAPTFRFSVWLMGPRASRAHLAGAHTFGVAGREGRPHPLMGIGCDHDPEWRGPSRRLRPLSSLASWHGQRALAAHRERRARAISAPSTRCGGVRREPSSGALLDRPKSRLECV